MFMKTSLASTNTTTTNKMAVIASVKSNVYAPNGICGVYGGIRIILPKQEENNYENLIPPTKIFTVYLFAESMYFTVNNS